MVADPNNREFSRSPTSFPVRLELGESEVVGKLRNISLRGALLSCDTRLPVGTHCALTIPLEGGVEIKARATVVRETESDVAVELTDVDMDGLEHLRRLVLYNAEDPERAYCEFLAHVGLKRP